MASALAFRFYLRPPCSFDYPLPLNAMNTYLRILAFVRPYKLAITLYILLALLAVITTSLGIALLDPVLNLLFSGDSSADTLSTGEFSLSIKRYFNSFIAQYLEDGNKLKALSVAIITIVSVNIIGNVLRYLSNLMMAYLRTKTLEDLRSYFFEKVNNLQISYFEGERKGDLMARMTSDIYEVDKSIVVTFRSLIRDPFTIIVFLALMLAFSWKLTLFIFILLPLSAGVITLITRSLKRDAFRTQDKLSRIMSVVEEFAGGVRIIKAFNGEGYIQRVFKHYNGLYSHYARRQFYKQGLIKPFSEIMGVITIGLILWFGGRLVFEGTINASGFITYIFYFQRIMQPAKSISSAFGNLNRGIASANRIFRVTDVPVTITEKPDALPVDDFQNQISFHNVSFAYTEERVLKDINLTIQKGEVVALVGPSGSGKTTLAEMLPRFYDPTEGCITLDGYDLKDYRIHSLRNIIGFVTQDPILFNDTIYNNIAFGIDEAKPDDVAEAARAANAHDFILEADNGYQTMIGDQGALLSGGQRQRLSIARAILKNPPIMILDEATSALDTSSEKMVQDALQHLMRDRTSLVIAHRLSTIQEADQIVVLDQGNIVEWGTHNRLVQQEGLYHSLYRMQQLEG